MERPDARAARTVSTKTSGDSAAMLGSIQSLVAEVPLAFGPMRCRMLRLSIATRLMPIARGLGVNLANSTSGGATAEQRPSSEDVAAATPTTTMGRVHSGFHRPSWMPPIAYVATDEATPIADAAAKRGAVPRPRLRGDWCLKPLRWAATTTGRSPVRGALIGVKSERPVTQSNANGRHRIGGEQPGGMTFAGAVTTGGALLPNVWAEAATTGRTTVGCRTPASTGIRTRAMATRCTPGPTESKRR